MSGKRKHRKTPNDILGIEIPKGDSKEDKKARKQLIKDFYSNWIAKNPAKSVWNKSLNAFIYIKGKSINETSGQASISYESTREVFRLTEILSHAALIKKKPPKRDNKNQKPYVEILVMGQESALLIVGKQETTGEYVQYCISARGKK